MPHMGRADTWEPSITDFCSRSRVRGTRPGVEGNPKRGRPPGSAKKKKEEELANS